MAFELPFPPSVPGQPALNEWLQQLYMAMQQNKTDASDLSTANSLQKIWVFASVSETPNGVTTQFTLANGLRYRSGKLVVFRGNSPLNSGVTENSATQFTLAAAPDADETIKVLFIQE